VRERVPFTDGWRQGKPAPLAVEGSPLILPFGQEIPSPGSLTLAMQGFGDQGVKALYEAFLKGMRNGAGFDENEPQPVLQVAEAPTCPGADPKDAQDAPAVYGLACKPFATKAAIS
jgi:hypothetical protein